MKVKEHIFSLVCQTSYLDIWEISIKSHFGVKFGTKRNGFVLFHVQNDVPGQSETLHCSGHFFPVDFTQSHKRYQSQCTGSLTNQVLLAFHPFHHTAHRKVSKTFAVK